MADQGAARVAIICGSPTERDTMARVGGMLELFGVAYDQTELSPHRSPRALADWIAELEPRGIEVVVAVGGVNASLASVVAAHVPMPVVGLPMRGGALNGLDALLSMVSMSPGVPVACVGLDHSTNAAVLAVQILAVGDPDLRARMAKFKDDFESSADRQ